MEEGGLNPARIKELNLDLEGYPEDLNLEGKGLGDEEVKVLATALRNNHCLKKLNLNGNRIGREGMRMLCDSLKINTSLTSLTLGRDESVKKGEGQKVGSLFAEVLQCNTPLTDLSLYWTEDDEKGWMALAHSLEENNRILKYLNVNHCFGLGLKGMKAFAAALRKNSVLQELGIVNTTGSAMGDIIAEALIKDNSSLKTLAITVLPGTHYWMEMLETNTSLTTLWLHLDLSGGRDVKEAVRDLGLALKNNTTLSFLDLRLYGTKTKLEASRLARALEGNIGLTDILLEGEAIKKRKTSAPLTSDGEKGAESGSPSRLRQQIAKSNQEDRKEKGRENATAVEELIQQLLAVNERQEEERGKIWEAINKQEEEKQKMQEAIKNLQEQLEVERKERGMLLNRARKELKKRMREREEEQALFAMHRMVAMAMADQQPWEEIPKESAEALLKAFSHVKLGNGAYGWVFKGEWNDEKVAIKYINMQKPVHEMEADLKKELTLINLSPSPFLLKSKAACTKDVPFLLVMELMDCNLSEFVKNNHPLSMAPILNLAIQITTGVLHLHKEGIIHRDIKPGNILLKKDENDEKVFHAKLCDFGTTRVVTIHNTASMVGSYSYMAPEVLDTDGKTGSYGTKADIFSLGAVYYFLSFGQSAFSGAERNLRPPLKGNEDRCPPMLQDMIRRCWTNAPKERPSARQLLRKLNILQAAIINPSPSVDGEKEKEKEAH